VSTCPTNVKLLRLLLPPVVPHFWLLTRKTHFLSPLEKHFRFVIQEEIEQKEVASNLQTLVDFSACCLVTSHFPRPLLALITHADSVGVLYGFLTLSFTQSLSIERRSFTQLSASDRKRLFITVHSMCGENIYFPRKFCFPHSFENVFAFQRERAFVREGEDR
jgi:hypothetical protein